MQLMGDGRYPWNLGRIALAAIAAVLALQRLAIADGTNADAQQTEAKKLLGEVASFVTGSASPQEPTWLLDALAKSAAASKEYPVAERAPFGNER